MGGFYWCLNLVLSQTSCFVAAKLYVGSGEEEPHIGNTTLGNTTAAEDVGGEGLPPSAVISIIQAAFALWLVSLIGFFSSIDKTYLHTFFDLDSGKQYLARKFRNATSDCERITIFGHHQSQFVSIQKEVKVWMNENYEVFEAEKPDFWTELRISMIPDDYIPKDELKFLEEKGRGGKRKRATIGVTGRASFFGAGEEGGLVGIVNRLSTRRSVVGLGGGRVSFFESLGTKEGVLGGIVKRVSIGARMGSTATVAPTPTPAVEPQA